MQRLFILHRWCNLSLMDVSNGPANWSFLKMVIDIENDRYDNTFGLPACIESLDFPEEIYRSLFNCSFWKMPSNSLKQCIRWPWINWHRLQHFVDLCCVLWFESSIIFIKSTFIFLPTFKFRFVLNFRDFIEPIGELNQLWLQCFNRREK